MTPAQRKLRKMELKYKTMVRRSHVCVGSEC